MIKLRRLLLWLPAVLMMCIIFAFSVETGEQSSQTSAAVCRTVAETTVKDFDELPFYRQLLIVESLQHTVRKTAHFTEYALLGMAFLLPLWNILRKKKYAAPCALLLSALYACSDEFHQSFSPNRSPQITDVLIDSTGALAGILIVCLIIYVIKRIRGRKNV